MDAITLIRAWAESKDLLLQEEAPDATQVVLLVLNGEEIPGDLKIVGQITIRQVNREPVSFAIDTCDGNMILDESWADRQSLPSILDYALGLLQGRVKSPRPQRALAMVDPKKRPL
jgi:hypothetical protein